MNEIETCPVCGGVFTHHVSCPWWKPLLLKTYEREMRRIWNVVEESELIEERRIHGFTKQSLEETRDLVHQLRTEIAKHNGLLDKAEIDCYPIPVSFV